MDPYVASLEDEFPKGPPALCAAVAPHFLAACCKASFAGLKLGPILGSI